MTFQHLVVRPRLEALTGARGPAALMVFAQHAGESGFLPIVAPASLAVSFFFVLSGFVLAYAYFDERFLGLQFIRARFARIWPATMLSILLVLVILPRHAYLPQQLDVLSSGLVFLTNGLLLQSLIPIPDFYFALNAVAWSISVEWCFYLVFPALNRLLRRFAVKPLVVLAMIGAFLTLLAIQLGWSAFDATALAQPTWHGIVYINPAVRLFEFGSGILAGQLWCKAKISLRREQLVALLRRSSLLWQVSIAEVLLLGCLFYLLFISYQWDPGIAVAFGDSVRLLLLQWWSAIVLVALTCLLAFRLGFFTRSILCHPSMLRLGELSFGIYLFHQPLLKWLTLRFANPQYNMTIFKTMPTWSYSIILLTLTLILSAFSHDLLEPRARRWLVNKPRR